MSGTASSPICRLLAALDQRLRVTGANPFERTSLTDPTVAREGMRARRLLRTQENDHHRMHDSGISAFRSVSCEPSLAR